MVTKPVFEKISCCNTIIRTKYVQLDWILVVKMCGYL